MAPSRIDGYTTDGSRLLYTLTGLVRGTENQVRVSALTVNNKPMTEWLTAETFENDLNESQLPAEPPSSLRGSNFQNK